MGAIRYFGSGRSLQRMEVLVARHARRYDMSNATLDAPDLTNFCDDPVALDPRYCCSGCEHAWR